MKYRQSKLERERWEKEREREERKKGVTLLRENILKLYRKHCESPNVKKIAKNERGSLGHIIRELTSLKILNDAVLMRTIT